MNRGTKGVEMRILFVIDTLASGGKERRLTELLKALVHRPEVSSELVILSNDIHYTEVFTFNIAIHQIIRRSRKDLAVFGQLRSILKAFNPDAVHCWESMTAVYLAPLCRIMKYPLINGMITNVPLVQNITNRHWLRARLTFPFSDVIVSNSKAGLEAYRAPSGKSVVIYNGFNFNRIKGVLTREEARLEIGIRTSYVVGMVASFWQQKDYPTFYETARILLRKRQDITFLAIGSGTDSPDSIHEAGQDFKDNFVFMGKQSRIESLISAMDVCILATFTEGISNSLLEYMAMGKPVVATRGGGTEELIKDGMEGLLVTPRDPGMMADKIEILLNNSGLRDKLGTAARTRIIDAFSIDRMVNDYIGLYRKVTGMSN